MSRPIFFQTAHLNDQDSIDQFIVRQHELDRLLSEIRSDDMSGSIQHYVLIGQRGSGKSTLLRRVQAAVRTEPMLSGRLVAVNLSEEQAGIYRLHDLWHRVSEELSEQGFHVDEVDWGRFDDDRVALARAAYMALQKGLREAKRKLVLLLDNIDRIFKNLDKDEAHLFRELLINHHDVRIIGGSTLLSEHHWKYDQPFYEFFQMIPLSPLSSDEMRALLIAWSNLLQLPEVRMFAESGDGRLEALRILSDGMPRTMLQLVDLITQRPDQDSYEYLLHIVDKATAIYQERLGTLSPHQQKVLLELSFFWEAATAGQLKETARMDVKPLSAALNKLTEMGYVETLPGKNKHHLYRVKERFFNLWLIMTQGGARQRRRVRYLTIFLEIWYGKEGLGTYLSGYRERLQQGGVDPGHAALITQALARSTYVAAVDRDGLIEATRPLVQARKELVEHLPRTSVEACRSALGLLEKSKYAEARMELNDLEQETAIKRILLGWCAGGLGDLDSCTQLVELGILLDEADIVLNAAGHVFYQLKKYVTAEAYYLRAIDKGHVDALFNLANLYQEIGKTEEAEKLYLRAIDKGHVDALLNLANLYQKIDKTEEAEAFYLRAIDKEDVGALFNLANIYRETGKAEKAEEFYLRAINKGHVNALNNLANFYVEIGRTEEAEKFYLRAIDKGQVNALNNLAVLYQETDKTQDAEEFYLRAIDKGHADALFNLANLYQDTGKTKKAEEFYLRAIEKGDVDALFNLANLYRKTGNAEKAEEFYLRAIDKGYVNALNNLATHYAEIGKTKDAEEFYLRAIEKGDVGALFNLANIYRETGKAEKAEEFYLRAIEKGNVDALFNLALFDYLRGLAPVRALDLMRRLKRTTDSYRAKELALETVLLTWSGRPEDAPPIGEVLGELLVPSSNGNLDFWARQFVIHHRAKEVWACFTGEALGATLKERLQPLYFATAQFVGKTGEDAVRVMPSELFSTVEDIVKTITDERSHYYSHK